MACGVHVKPISCAIMRFHVISDEIMWFDVISSERAQPLKLIFYDFSSLVVRNCQLSSVLCKTPLSNEPSSCSFVLKVLCSFSFVSPQRIGIEFYFICSSVLNQELDDEKMSLRNLSWWDALTFLFLLSSSLTWSLSWFFPLPSDGIPSAYPYVDINRQQHAQKVIFSQAPPTCYCHVVHVAHGCLLPLWSEFPSVELDFGVCIIIWKFCCWRDSDVHR